MALTEAQQYLSDKITKLDAVLSRLEVDFIVEQNGEKEARLTQAEQTLNTYLELFEETGGTVIRGPSRDFVFSL